jgi:hypothetical protein
LPPEHWRRTSGPKIGTEHWRRNIGAKHGHQTWAPNIATERWPECWRQTSTPQNVARIVAPRVSKGTESSKPEAGSTRIGL